MSQRFYWPDYAPVRKAKFSVSALTRGFESALTRQALYERLAGERWTAQIELVPLNRANANALRAFLAMIDGMSGQIVIADPTYPGPSGAIATFASYGFSDGTSFGDGTQFGDGASVVSVGVQTRPLDESVALTGLPASLAAALAAGDMIQVGHEFDDASQLLQVAVGGSTDAGGNLRVSVRPRVRSSFPAGARVYLAAPKCVMRLGSDDQAGIDIDADQGTHAVKLIEAI